jgi:hypothetical protein
MVRTTSAIGPFCRAKTCSTAERTADLRALACRVLAAIGRPGGFFRWMRETRPLEGSQASTRWSPRQQPRADVIGEPTKGFLEVSSSRNRYAKACATALSPAIAPSQRSSGALCAPDDRDSRDVQMSTLRSRNSKSLVANIRPISLKIQQIYVINSE